MLRQSPERRNIVYKGCDSGHRFSPDGKPTDRLWVQRDHGHLFGPMILT